MNIVSAIAGALLGLILFGIAVLALTTIGLPSGPGWWVIGVPFVVLMAWLASIQE